ncbi:25S rRNA (adenine645-N1)-methyltransferase [Puccinia graminis f. sp. tritici]|uniref:Ribosomal RNA-processing protein 8 n=1 Tax=Puccinia graminis f. sp. tritici TaxID=56615 RepID=A0A5B0LRZ6_PUCGR|nr:25S rRNA (adenine645-N1)-methyltransferase [Puccinia graminis f. sp. tritici]
MKKPTNKLLFDTPGWTIPKENINSEKKAKRKKNRNKPTTERPSSDQQQEHSPSPKRLKNSHPHNNKQQQQQQQPTKNQPNETLHVGTHQLAKGLLNSNLNGSRFRILNETLYTSTGPEALKLFQSNPIEAAADDEEEEGGGEHTIRREENPNFEIYHLGFRSQTKHWPQNPVDLIAHELQQDPHLQKIPGPALVADLGCGEAPLAKLLCSSPSTSTSNQKNSKPIAHHNQFKVFSYDLVADREGWITVAECSSLVPLPGSLDDRVGNGMMDIVVCCLSLMSTNWVGMILEARRILKHDGELRIAEVTSRFVDVDLFVTFIKSIGFSNPTKDQSNTHFILFKFKKLPLALAKNHRDSSSVDLLNPKSKLELIQTGQKLLKPCIYKRR